MTIQVVKDVRDPRGEATAPEESDDDLSHTPDLSLCFVARKRENEKKRTSGKKRRTKCGKRSGHVRTWLADTNSYKKSLTESNTISVHREGHIREIKRPVVTMKENMVASFLCSPV